MPKTVIPQGGPGPIYRSSLQIVAACARAAGMATADCTKSSTMAIG